MIGSSMYLTGIEVDTGNYIENANSCSMCKRLIINAGIKKVYIRESKENYRMILVEDWVENDETMEGKFGY
jgi:Deoxycytidylate deaminase